MNRIKTTSISLLLIACLFIISCIEPYELPNVAEDFVASLVIDGTISNDDTVQTITVSRTRSLEDNNGNIIDPVSGCNISVIDKDGTVFQFQESDKDGYYQGIIPQQYFQIGNTFKLHLISPNDEVYESTEEELLPVAAVDSVYFSNIYNSDNQEVGVRFKVDINGALNESRNYKWKLVETYEYHASYPINLIYRGANNVEERDYDMSHYKCYRTNTLTGSIFMASTDKLSENRFVGATLNSVSHSSGRLKNKYSLLVKQYSISKDAARFWSQMQDNQKEGGMFDGQPITVDGNIININNTDERVLGFFGASMVSQKRIFAQRTSNFYSSGCMATPLTELDLDSLIDVSSASRPLYVLIYTEGDPPVVVQRITAPGSCFDCTLRGGTISKPAYWDDESITLLLNEIE